MSSVTVFLKKAQKRYKFNLKDLLGDKSVICIIERGNSLFFKDGKEEITLTTKGKIAAAIKDEITASSKFFSDPENGDNYILLSLSAPVYKAIKEKLIGKKPNPQILQRTM